MSNRTGVLLSEYGNRIIELESQLAARDEEIAKLKEKSPVYIKLDQTVEQIQREGAYLENMKMFKRNADEFKIMNDRLKSELYDRFLENKRIIGELTAERERAKKLVEGLKSIAGWRDVALENNHQAAYEMRDEAANYLAEYDAKYSAEGET